MAIDSPVELEPQRIARIGSSNLIYYLAGVPGINRGILRGDLDDFEKQIEIPEVVHQAMKEMYEEKREGEAEGVVHKRRRQVRANALEQIAPGMGDEIMSIKEPRGEVERARVAFLDIGTMSIATTPSTFGYGKEVDIGVPLRAATSEERTPIIGIHTHPDDENFSFSDYSLMLIGEPHEKMRILRASIVLLPGAQIMAVATSETPIYSEWKDVQRFVQNHTDSFDREHLLLAERVVKELKKIYDKKRIIEAIDGIKDTLGDKYASVANELKGRFGVQGEETALLEAKAGELVQRSRDESARAANSQKVAFGRELNVKLYMSRDMRTFKEFSA